MRRILYKLLDSPFVYGFSQIFLAPGAKRFLKKKYDVLFANSKDHILDVGCGPALLTPKSQSFLVGLDISLKYVSHFVKQSDHKGIVGSSNLLPFKNKVFDERRSVGLLHHLPEDMAVRTVQEMVRCVRPSGRVVIVDNVWPRRALLRPIAWLIRRFDRGQWIRSQEDLTQLIQKSVPGSWNIERFTYTFHGLEGITYIFEKSS